MENDPVFQVKGQMTVHAYADELVTLIPDKWYFYDELWVNVYGPFDTEEIARVELDSYVLDLG